MEDHQMDHPPAASSPAIGWSETAGTSLSAAAFPTRPLACTMSPHHVAEPCRRTMPTHMA
jgi:hypothetical protein